MITRDSDKSHLQDLKELLESKGIPAIIQGENTARMIIPYFAFQPTLWVYLDEQFDDAVQLISNPAYKVQSGIDIKEFYSSVEKLGSNQSKMNKVYIDLGLFFVGILVVIFVIIQILNKL